MVIFVRAATLPRPKADVAMSDKNASSNLPYFGKRHAKDDVKTQLSISGPSRVETVLNIMPGGEAE